jgi:hypothetical protein
MVTQETNKDEKEFLLRKKTGPIKCLKEAPRMNSDVRQSVKDKSHLPLEDLKITNFGGHTAEKYVIIFPLASWG